MQFKWSFMHCILPSLMLLLMINGFLFQDIREFLDYLSKWEKLAAATGIHFLSPSTCNGLKVTLTAILELLSFLVTKHNFKLLITAWLNPGAAPEGGKGGQCPAVEHICPSPSESLLWWKIIANLWNELRKILGILETNQEESTKFASFLRNNCEFTVDSKIIPELAIILASFLLFFIANFYRHMLVINKKS